MKRHLSTLTALKGAFLAGSVLGVLAFLPSRDVAADPLPDPNRIFSTKNGDADADGLIAINDAMYLLRYLYIGGPRPKPLFCEPFADVHNGDVNGSGHIDLSDAIRLLNWLFSGGSAPVEGCPNAG